MPYITIKQSPVFYQMTFEDIMAGISDIDKYVKDNKTNTRTYWVDYPSEELLKKTPITRMIRLLEEFNKSKEHLFIKDRKTLYNTFYAPKSHGGLRRIDTPTHELMNAVRELKCLIESHIFSLYHTTAFAYIRGRSTIDAIKTASN